MDTDNSLGKAGRVGASWRVQNGEKWGKSVILTTIKSKVFFRKNNRHYQSIAALFLTESWFCLRSSRRRDRGHLHQRETSRTTPLPRGSRPKTVTSQSSRGATCTHTPGALQTPSSHELSKSPHQGHAAPWPRRWQGSVRCPGGPRTRQAQEEPPHKGVEVVRN